MKLNVKKRDESFVKKDPQLQDITVLFILLEIRNESLLQDKTKQFSYKDHENLQNETRFVKTK